VISVYFDLIEQPRFKIAIIFYIISNVCITIRVRDLNKLQ